MFELVTIYDFYYNRFIVIVNRKIKIFRKLSNIIVLWAAGQLDQACFLDLPGTRDGQAPRGMSGGRGGRSKWLKYPKNLKRNIYEKVLTIYRK